MTSPFRRFSTLIASDSKQSISSNPKFPLNLGRRNRNVIPIPHRTIPHLKGQDLDFVNVAYSHVIHSDWNKLHLLATHLTPCRVKHVLLKIRKDYVLSLEFFNWVKTLNPNFHTLESHSIILHILTKNRKFKSAESILRSLLILGSVDMPDRLFEAVLYSYRMCDSSPRVFDSLFKTYAHMKKFRNASDTFSQMKVYGFFPPVESCNAYLSSLLDLRRADIALAFYKEMGRCRISANVYTLNMVMHAFCQLGKLEKAVNVMRDMETMGITPNVASFNTLIAGHCHRGLLNLAMKLKNMMGRNGVEPNVVTYNSLIYGFCKEGKLQEANKVFSEMKVMKVAPNTITYNTLINGYSQASNTDMAGKVYEEMSQNGVKADILTYNALILGLCKEGKIKKASCLVKELDKKNLVPNASTFSALISGQCIKKNSDRAFQLYKSMVRSGCHPNEQTFNMLISTFCENDDFEGALYVLTEMFRRCMTPGSEALSEIYNGLCRCRKDHLAIKLCGEMEAINLMPTIFDKAKCSNLETRERG
ncbi:hypothetical protein K2173_007582 [Erythroxylum novogranatense]|uniref:Pentatricopeptide repeat-containing protein n=1 Tax=Erythroxylum novogranatense TaxID=1862640 RepID=A0AAV8S8Z6_9ROSI|nr:hypothetical protein K2173_007582 [Erythroxylum novogranatense]